MEEPNRELGLVKAAREGDPEAFRALHDRYRPRVLRYVQSRMRDAAEADDVTQEVFLRMHKGLDRFEGRSSFSTWILGIARHETLFRLRTLRRRRAREVAEEHDAPAEVVSLERALHARRTLQATTRVLESLEPERLDLLVAPVVGDVSVAELARRRGVRPGAIKSRQHRIRQAVRAAVADAGA